MADGPNIDLIVPRSDEISSFYQAADRMGFHSLWFTEMVFSQGWVDKKGQDPFGVLAAAAAVTSRIRLGAAPPGNSSPTTPILSFAEETASVDILSSGRLSLGLSRDAGPMRVSGNALTPG